MKNQIKRIMVGTTLWNMSALSIWYQQIKSAIPIQLPYWLDCLKQYEYD